jgi:uncharacterized protein YcbX
MNATTKVIGVITAIHRYPVKSMLGEELTAAAVKPRGLAGDRIYALIDSETGRVISSKRPKRWSRIFELRAYTDNAVWVQFPTGEALHIDDASLPTRLGEFFGRAVSVSSSPAPDAQFDEAWVRDLKNGADPYFGQPSRLEDGEEMIAGGSSMGRDGNFFNLSPIHIVTTSSLRALSEAAPASRFDAQRFRPNIIIDTPGSGFLEADWPERKLHIGTAEFRVTINVPRCVVTILAQGTLPQDPAILRTITSRNAIDVFQTGTQYPCLGIYAEVLHAGEIHVGDIATFE